VYSPVSYLHTLSLLHHHLSLHLQPLSHPPIRCTFPPRFLDGTQEFRHSPARHRHQPTPHHPLHTPCMPHLAPIMSARDPAVTLRLLSSALPAAKFDPSTAHKKSASQQQTGPSYTLTMVPPASYQCPMTHLLLLVSPHHLLSLASARLSDPSSSQLSSIGSHRHHGTRRGGVLSC
jgi:hypothetical protein